MTKTRATSLLTTGLVLVLACVAFAATGEEHGEHHAPGVTSLLFPVINFALFAWLVWSKGWPAIRRALLDRRTRIQGEIADAERAHTDALAQLKSVEALRSGQKQEFERLVSEIRAESEFERRHVLDAARGSAARILRDAELLGVQEAAAAARTVRASLADEVIARATVAIRDRFDDDDQRRAIVELTTRLARSGEEAPA